MATALRTMAWRSSAPCRIGPSAPRRSWPSASRPRAPARRRSRRGRRPPRSSQAAHGGSIELGDVRPDGSKLSVRLVFASAGAALLRIAVAAPAGMALGRLRLVAEVQRATGLTAWPSGAAIRMDLPDAPQDAQCLSPGPERGGVLYLGSQARFGAALQDIEWSTAIGAQNATASAVVDLRAETAAELYVAITSSAQPAPWRPSFLDDASVAEATFQAATDRWDRYLSAVLPPSGQQDGAGAVDMRWAAVKSLQTLLHNWRRVPGLPDGVLPSYTGYQNGFWSWDSYKQAVGMALFSPRLAKQQLRLMATAQDPSTGHIPDKVSRCGVGGGCSGKPPLLSWAVWEVYRRTGDTAFLREMYPVMRSFHAFWYRHRDVHGVGLCSWTEGMESGMDDAARFLPEYASGVRNASTQVATLDFWSVDLNSHLYQEKRLLAFAARELGDDHAAAAWTSDADALLPRLQELFFVPSTGFFQDRYFNGTSLPLQGCEGYAALFAEVATPPQAARVAASLADERRFLANFSLPTLSRADRHYEPKGYWKGPTWVDQVWFAYSGLRAYAARAGAAQGDAEVFDGVASEIRRRIFQVGRGLAAGDTTPLAEHYDAETGEPLGATHFGWTAAHILLWASEAAAAPGARGAVVVV